MVEIRRNGTVGCFEPNRVIRVPDERRVAIDVGIDCDRLEIRILERSQRFDGTDAAHRRFPAIEDGESVNGSFSTQRRTPCSTWDRYAMLAYEASCESDTHVALPAAAHCKTRSAFSIRGSRHANPAYAP